MFPHGIMFHHFYDDKSNRYGQGAISGEEFRKVLDYYRKDHRLIGASEYCEKAVKGILSEDEVCITFDDDLRCQYDVAAPILKEQGLTAFYFVYTSPFRGVIEKIELYRHFRSTMYTDIEEFYEAFFSLAKSMETELGCRITEELSTFDPSTFAREFAFYTPNDRRFRYLRNNVLGEVKYDCLMERMMSEKNYRFDSNLIWMNQEELKALSDDGNIIGLHSHTHPTDLTHLTYDEQKKEYLINKEILEEITGKSMKTVSYPCNSYNDDTLKLMQELGIQLGFRADRKYGYKSCMEISRQDHANIMREIRDQGTEK